MTEWLPVVLAAAFVAVAILVLVWNRRRGDRRWTQLAVWAYKNGLDYHPEDDPSLWVRFRSFRCLQLGTENHGYNVMNGVFGRRRVCAFDYHCEELVSDEDAVLCSQLPLRDFSCVVVEAGVPLGTLLLRPAGPLHEVGDSMGPQDIHLESVAFNRKYRVESTDRRWAYAVLNQKTMELMLNQPSFIIDFQGSQVMARWERKRFSPRDFRSALTVVAGMLDNLLPDVVDQLKETGSGGKVS